MVREVTTLSHKLMVLSMIGRNVVCVMALDGWVGIDDVVVATTQHTHPSSPRFPWLTKLLPRVVREVA